jgi:deoxyadenosine/deoxycytidine kinase
MTAVEATNRGFLIGVVGVCAAGKSTLVEALRARGYLARHIAQEHSFVRDMWQRITDPDVLVFLDASYEVTLKRRGLDWREQDWAEQQRRLGHAREHADLYIATDLLAPGEVLARVLAFVEKSQ